MRSGKVLLLVENCSVPTDVRAWWECTVLSEAGMDVTVICPQGETRDRSAFERRDGVDIHRYPTGDWPATVRGHLAEYLQAARHITMMTHRLARREHFDVVHACNPPDYLLLTALPLKRKGTRFIFDHHDLSPELYATLYGDKSRLLYGATRAMERMAFLLADVVIATNESYRDVAIQRGKKDPEDVLVVRNAPDTTRFRPRAPDPEVRRGADHLLGYVGHMGWQDGVDNAVRALAALRRRRSDWRAVFMGGGAALEGVRQLARELELEDVVEFRGFVEDEEVVRVLASADVCLSPEPVNVFNDASTWIKVGEYLAMGKPVVCYDLTESRRTAGAAAEYARAGDEEHFAECISALLDDPARREEMGAIGRRRMEAELSMEHSQRALLAAYDRALNGRMERAARATSRA